MAKFFTSPKDLVRWVKESNTSFSEAAHKLMLALGSKNNEQDIIETTKRIASNNNAEEASKVLYDLLSQYDITESSIKEAEHKHDLVVASEYLSQTKVITADEKKEMVKEAQIMRQPGQYNMDLRVCPKLPYSVGKRLVSTYNCRHYCLDSITFDEDPTRVFCVEAMWRQHVMDKFSREWQDAKTGEWVGGYINNRFYVFPDAGTPDNQDVTRTHGNKMSLRPWERTRQPKKNEWSVERRLQEQRNPNTTKSITLSSVLTNSKKMIKMAASDIKQIPEENNIEKIFSDAINLHNNGMSKEAAVLELSEKHNVSIEKVATIQEAAIKKMSSHQADVYKVAATVGINNSGFYVVKQNDIPAQISKGTDIGNLTNGTLPPGTPFKQRAPNAQEIKSLGNIVNKSDVFDIHDPQNTNNIVGTAYVAQTQQVIPNLSDSWDNYQSIQVGLSDLGEQGNKNLLAGQEGLPGKGTAAPVGSVGEGEGAPAAEAPK